MNSIRRIIPAQAPRLLFGCIALAAMSSPSAFAEDVLKGKVQKGDQPVRIARPTMPVLGTVQATDLGAMKLPETPKAMPPLTGIAADDYALNFGKSSKLIGEAEDPSMIIAWEEWHHRLSRAIFERWRVLGIYPGTANTTITITNDRRINVQVSGIQLDENIYEIMQPQYRMLSLERLTRDFASSIEQSVLPLNGSSVLTFPEGSKRRVVTLTPDFSGTESEGYHWRHDDYERVPVKAAK